MLVAEKVLGEQVILELVEKFKDIAHTILRSPSKELSDFCIITEELPISLVDRTKIALIL